jgi:xanthine/CO dehydrogenase XdhC/CoxF family maturation factor
MAMTELADICREAAALRARNVPFLLATVMRVTGSSYRRPGARMLVAEDRWLAGSVSGGCLESDVLRRGAFRARHGGPVLVTYDSTSDDDEHANVGTGCNGVVELLLERIDAATTLDPVSFAGACLDAEEQGALATVFVSRNPSVPVGARIAAREGRIETSTIVDESIRASLAGEALGIVAAGNRRARVRTVGDVTALVESFAPVPHLFVMGARHDALSLLGVAKAAGLRITIVDSRDGVGLRSRFAGADRILIGDPTTIAQVVSAHARAAVVVMNHDYERDRDCLEAALATRAFYVGVLGPRARTERMLAELHRADDPRLHAPAGLDLAAETPAEIALAIVAEIQLVLAGASGGRLRDRQR